VAQLWLELVNSSTVLSALSLSLLADRHPVADVQDAVFKLVDR